MSVSSQSEQTLIARLRVKGSGLDPALARLRLTGLLNTVGLRPAGLAPNALVIIRELRDPLPGHLRLQGTRPPPEWERALGSRLEQLLRRAGRPALELVDDRAEAVVFLDRSELLACMASDWCRGGTLNRWWWRSLFNGPDIAQIIVRQWLEATQYIPAALNHLSKRRDAIPFLRALDAVHTRALLDGLIHSFALSRLKSVLDAGQDAFDSATSDDRKESHAEMAASRSSGEPSRAAATRKAPWRPVVPEAEGSRLDFAAQCLLGIGLMLQRAPSALRSEAFARELSSWRRSFVEERRGPTSEADEKARSFSSDEAREAPLMWLRETADAAAATPASRFETFAPGGEVKAGASSPLEPASHAAHDDKDVAGGDVLARQGGPETHGQAETAPLPQSVFESSQPLQESGERRCETEFGGLFYLINLGLFLGLYGDFTSPDECDPSLSIWDFVALLGAELSGEKIESDPVWSLLAALAGRAEGESPGANFDAPSSWRMPLDWLKPFAERCLWQWTIESGRLRVSHARGFLVLDVPLTRGDDDAAAQLASEMENYLGAAEFELSPGPLFEEPENEPPEEPESKPLRRWLNWLMPYARARLAQALGLREAGDLSRVLCEHHARVVVTETHLDVLMSLLELPVGIRLSGLDRDPGWVPAAGKFVAFHFA